MEDAGAVDIERVEEADGGAGGEERGGEVAHGGRGHLRVRVLQPARRRRKQVEDACCVASVAQSPRGRPSPRPRQQRAELAAAARLAQRAPARERRREKPGHAARDQPTADGAGAAVGVDGLEEREARGIEHNLQSQGAAG